MLHWPWMFPHLLSSYHHNIRLHKGVFVVSSVRLNSEVSPWYLTAYFWSRCYVQCASSLSKTSWLLGHIIWSLPSTPHLKSFFIGFRSVHRLYQPFCGTLKTKIACYFWVIMVWQGSTAIWERNQECYTVNNWQMLCLLTRARITHLQNRCRNVTV